MRQNIKKITKRQGRRGIKEKKQKRYKVKKDIRERRVKSHLSSELLSNWEGEEPISKYDSQKKKQEVGNPVLQGQSDEHLDKKKTSTPKH